MIEIREITTQDEFNSFIGMNKDNLHVIKIGAEWCGPCNHLSETIKNLDSNKVNNAIFAEIDVEGDETEDIINEYKIKNIPVILFFKDNELVHKTVGSLNSDTLYNIINEYR